MLVILCPNRTDNSVTATHCQQEKITWVAESGLRNIQKKQINIYMLKGLGNQEGITLLS
jgi:hypothetical protein